jgi:hypothetical protein
MMPRTAPSLIDVSSTDVARALLPAAPALLPARSGFVPLHPAFGRLSRGPA